MTTMMMKTMMLNLVRKSCWEIKSCSYSKPYCDVVPVLSERIVNDMNLVD